MFPNFKKAKKQPPPACVPVSSPPPIDDIILVTEETLPAESCAALDTANQLGRHSLVTVLVDGGQSDDQGCLVLTDVHLRRSTLETPIGVVTIAVHGGEVSYRLENGKYVMGSLAERAQKPTYQPVDRSVTITEKVVEEQNLQNNTEGNAKGNAEASLTGVKAAGELSGSLKTGLNNKQVGELTRTFTDVSRHYPCIASPLADGVALTITPLVGADGTITDNTGNAWPQDIPLFAIRRTGDGPVKVHAGFRPEQRFLEYVDGTGEFQKLASEEQRCLVRLLLTKLVEGRTWDLGESEILPAKSEAK